MCQFKDKYEWLTSVINHLKNCDQNLMIDSMKSYDFSKLPKHDRINGLEEIFILNFPVMSGFYSQLVFNWDLPGVKKYQIPTKV